MKYFEVLYLNWCGLKKKAIIATKHDTPETQTVDFDFNWNGNQILEYHTTNQFNYAHNIFKHF